MAVQPVRIGIVGCGDVLSAYMAMGARLRQRGLVQIVAACATSAQKRERICQAYAIPHFTTDYHELILDNQVEGAFQIRGESI
jgi:predicted dehydrogenase